MTAAFASAAPFVVLHAVRIVGRAPTDRMPAFTGLSPEVIGAELQRAAAADDLAHHDGALQGWSLTAAGRLRHADLLAHERDAAGRDADIAAAYVEFVGMNEWFKTLCTEWQLHDRPRSCIDRLAARHRQVEALTRRLAGALTRFDPYGARLTGALDRLEAGDPDAFATPLAESYHDVWMHLHQDLLLTLGRDRSVADGS